MNEIENITGSLLVKQFNKIYGDNPQDFCGNPTTKSFCHKITAVIRHYLDEAVNCHETAVPVV